MDKMNSVSIAIAWCLAWGNEHQPQFDISVLQQMREALKNGGEVPEAVKEIVEQVREFQSIPDDYFPQTLDDLKNKYPKLWNQTTKIGLVYGGVTKVKQYVFESSKIQEIRGASGLLDRINIIDLPAFFNKPTESNLYRFYDPTVREWLQLNFPNSNLLEALIPELIIYSCGGNILAFCPAAYVHNLADAIEKRYTTETLTANSCAVGDTFRLLEIRFGVFKENIEDTPWLNWYHKNYQNPIVQAYFGYPKDEKERLAVFQNRKSFNEITTKLAVLFNQRRSGNDIPGRKTTRRYPPMLETHPYLVRDGVENRSAILQIDKEGRKVNFSEASVRKYLFGDRAKDGNPNEPQWYINSQLEWRRGIVESWVDRFNEFLNENLTYEYQISEDDKNHHCLICQIFGNPVLPSRIIFDDLICEENPENLPEIIRPGVTINRRRRTAEESKLYFLETSPANTKLRFTGNIYLSNVPNYASPLILAGLRHINALGGSKSAGLGWLTWELPNLPIEAKTWKFLAKGVENNEKN
jgi:CRISPR-associated protein Cmr2